MRKGLQYLTTSVAVPVNVLVEMRLHSEISWSRVATAAFREELRKLKNGVGSTFIKGRKVVRAWQLRQMEKRKARTTQGLCGLCGKPREHYPTVCDDCAKKRRELARKRYGSLPRKQFGRGRLPIDPKAHSESETTQSENTHEIQ